MVPPPSALHELLDCLPQGGDGAAERLRTLDGGTLAADADLLVAEVPGGKSRKQAGI